MAAVSGCGRPGKVKSEKVLATQSSCLTLCDPTDYAALQAPLSLGFSRQEYWSGLPCPPPGIFLTQRSNPGVLHCRWILYCLSHQVAGDLGTIPSCLNLGSWGGASQLSLAAFRGSVLCEVLDRLLGDRCSSSGLCPGFPLFPTPQPGEAL